MNKDKNEQCYMMYGKVMLNNGGDRKLELPIQNEPKLDVVEITETEMVALVRRPWGDYFVTWFLPSLNKAYTYIPGE